MSQNDNRSIILWMSAIGESVNHAGKGGVHRCLGRDAEIHAKMNRATLTCGSRSGECIIRIDESGLVITTNNNARISGCH